MYRLRVKENHESRGLERPSVEDGLRMKKGPIPGQTGMNPALMPIYCNLRIRRSFAGLVLSIA
jgi:hypothetical protein